MKRCQEEGLKWDGVKAEERGELWVALLTWEHVTVFVRQMVRRYFITQHQK